jgi:phosphatidylserine decarboxylase
MALCARGLPLQSRDFQWRLNHMDKALASVIAPIHRAGYPFVGAAVVIALIGFIVSPVLGLALSALAGWVAYFFRDPPRVTPVRAGLVISPADGRVEPIARAPAPPELAMGSEPRTRVSIFLNVFDVHVNRVPIDGRVAALHYHPGKFLNAAHDKASEDNERMSIRLACDDGREFAVVQIAGLVARRIVCDLAREQRVRAGERLGIIRFGSRVDVYLPDGVAPLVVAGQRVIGGESVIADIGASEPAREGEVR